MSVTAAIRQMLSAGLSIEQALIAAEAFEVSMPPAEPPRSKGAVRQARYRRNKASQNVTGDACDAGDVTGVTGDDLSSPEGSFPKPLSPNPLQSIPPSPPKGGSSPTPKSQLEAVLDPSRAEAVIQHRQRIRKPLTAHGAKLLAGKFLRCSDPNAAADAMIVNGWQGFEVEWMENRTSRHQPQAPPPKPKSDFMRHQDEVQRVLDEATGQTRDDQFTGNTFDLGPRDYRSG